MKTRLLAVMIADVSGYTAFSAAASRRDVENAIRQQKRLLAPVIKKYRGRIVKWMGDAALATFESATDAILCGREMQLAVTHEFERGRGVIKPEVKIVVHAGDIAVDDDGDIYGTTVNTVARMEKAAESAEVYFSDVVRQLVSRAEIPFERVGSFDFKGIPEPVEVYRTCFGQTPVMRERLVLVQTNFTQVQTLADKHGWDTLHPVLEDMTGAIIDATRANGGTHRGVMQTGCFLTFTSCRDALAAIQGWQDAVRRVVARSKIPPDDLRVRVGIHHGTLHVMKFTLMGRDVEVVRHVATVGTGAEILWTHPAKEVATGERIEGDFVHREPMQLRACRERDKWIEKYADIAVFAMPLPPVSAVPAPARATKKKPSAVSS